MGRWSWVIRGWKEAESLAPLLALTYEHVHL
jgi:hypothetical protein